MLLLSPTDQYHLRIAKPSFNIDHRDHNLTTPGNADWHTEGNPTQLSGCYQPDYWFDKLVPIAPTFYGKMIFIPC